MTPDTTDAYATTLIVPAFIVRLLQSGVPCVNVVLLVNVAGMIEAPTAAHLELELLQVSATLAAPAFD
jgi:hypothetical protein